MQTLKIFNQRNNNILKRIVMDVKSKPDLYFNPKFNPNQKEYQEPLKK